MSLTDLAAIAAISTAVVGCATAYLQSFVSNKIGEMEDRIMDKVDTKFSRSDLIEQRLREFDRRITSLEAKRE